VEQQSIVAKLENLSSETKTLEAIYQKKLDNFRGIKEKPVKRVFRGELTRD
jgi:type I restriction enzyme S subunit